MAVPKKKRIGYRFLNKGSQTRHWYLNILGLKLSKFSGLYLKKLETPTKAILTKKQKFLVPQTGGALRAPLVPSPKPMPDVKNPPLVPTPKPRPDVKNPLEEAAKPAKISSKSLRSSLGHKPYWGLPLTKAKPKILMFYSLLAGPSVLLANYSYTSYLYRYSKLKAPSYYSLNFLKKEIFLSIQLPHRWGAQRDFFLKSWELSPKHFYISPTYKKYPPEALGLLKLNHPTNLKTPKGPSLGDLWRYIKANPNEGYWMYCMWLQIVKKWKRWVRFPLQYFYKRNTWKRFIFTKYYQEEIFAYKNFFLKRYPRLWAKIKKKYLKKKPKSALSLLTRFILVLDGLKPLKKRLPLFSLKEGAALKNRKLTRILSLSKVALKKILK